jgi:hypothetical protein
MENALVHGAVCGASQTLNSIALAPDQTAALLLAVISVVAARLLWLESKAPRGAAVEDGAEPSASTVPAVGRTA